MRSHENGDIVCMDALRFLDSLEESVADIVFLDPPFNLGKVYGNGSANRDKLRDDKYLVFIEAVIERSVAVLKDGGALYLYHIPKRALQFTPVLEKNLTFRHWIAVSMKNGFPIPNHLYPAHYALLYYTKGKPQVFHRPKLPPQLCRHCKKQVKDYGGKKEFIKDGLNLSDFWDDLSPVRHRRHKNRPSNELPLAIPHRVVEMSGQPGGLLVDPFAGAGTAVIAACEQSMRFVACDREAEYCRTISDRLKTMQDAPRKVK